MAMRLGLREDAALFFLQQVAILRMQRWESKD
jgi:hypothetical protein